LDKKNLTKIVIVTGYKSDFFVNYIKSLKLNTKLTFINNEIYNKTNNIYSMYLAKEDMVNDDYYPKFLVDKVKDLILPVIERLENGEKDEAVIQESLDTMTLAINDLQEEFYEHDSELETMARDSIATTIGDILEYFNIDIDLETALAERDW